MTLLFEHISPPSLPPPGLPPGSNPPGEYGHDLLLAFSNVAIAEIFDKTWFLMILVSLQINKWLAFVGGYLALAVHVGIAAAIGYGAARIPGLKQSTLNFVTAGVLLVFALLYSWEAWETDPSTDLMQEGKEGADDLTFADGEAGKAEKEVPLPPPADAAGVYWRSGAWCPQCWCPAPRNAMDAPSGPSEARRLCPEWKLLNATRSFLVENCGGRAASAERRRKGEADGLLEKKPLTPWVQRLLHFGKVFLVVFLAEWGDRTQIVMVGLHAAHPVSPIVVGSLLAFLLLSTSAVLLSAYLSTKRLNARAVRAVIAVSFFVFAGISLNDGLQALHSNQYWYFDFFGYGKSPSSAGLLTLEEQPGFVEPAAGGGGATDEPGSVQGLVAGSLF